MKYKHDMELLRRERAMMSYALERAQSHSTRTVTDLIDGYTKRIDEITEILKQNECSN